MIQLRPHQARIVDSMTTNPKGKVIVPTGGGKTLCMIKDAERVFNSGNKWGFILKKADRKTIVVVSPRILLAQQHSQEFEDYLKLNPMLQRRVLHVHSGNTSHYSTTNPDAIREWNDKQRKALYKKGERTLRDIRLQNLGKKSEKELKHKITSK